MLIGNATINLSANIASALIGLLSVFVFTRLFTPHDYGIYLLGAAFAAVLSVFLAGWFRNLILNDHARDDGIDRRGLVVPGYLIVCLIAPGAYGLARWIGLDATTALAAVGLAIAIGVYELTQDLLRARLLAVAAMKATLIRAALLLALGTGLALVDRHGLVLLIAAMLAYLGATLIQSRRVWRGTRITWDRAKLVAAAKQGWPLTLSLTLLGISSVIDRFIIASLVGTTPAGQYIAGLDLVRQTLMMPAISVAAAFVPLAVNINASKGEAAARSHLRECIELLLAITLPACLGFAMISSHVANVVLGEDFRHVAASIMPIFAIAVLFQVLTQQYLHVSFLLSKKNGYYLANTASIIVVNVALSFVLIERYGIVGAAWARLGADLFGFACALALSRRAFAVPLPFARLGLVIVASLLMALSIRLVDHSLRVPDLMACIALVGLGVAVYAVLAWVFDIARCRHRLRVGLSMCRSKLARRGAG